MSLGNTPRKETNFAVDYGKSFAFGMLFIEEDGSVHSLQGLDARLVIANGPGFDSVEVVNMTADIIDHDLGSMQFSLQAEDLALEPGTYPYDVTLVPLEGYTVPLLKGVFEVGPNADRDTSNMYALLVVDPTITIVMDGYTVTKVTGS